MTECVGRLGFQGYDGHILTAILASIHPTVRTVTIDHVRFYHLPFSCTDPSKNARIIPTTQVNLPPAKSAVEKEFDAHSMHFTFVFAGTAFATIYYHVEMK